MDLEFRKSLLVGLIIWEMQDQDNDPNAPELAYQMTIELVRLVRV